MPVAERPRARYTALTLATARKRGPAWGKLAAIALVLIALAAAWRWTPLGEIATAENIVGWTRTVRGMW